MTKKTKKLSVQGTPVYRSFSRSNKKFLLILLLLGFLASLAYQKYTGQSIISAPATTQQ